METTIADRTGQAAEWLLWTRLTLTSPVHVFLPMRDMGVDGIVRLPGTDIATSIQVKSRHMLSDGKIHLLVRPHELRDPRAVIVLVVLDASQQRLHETCISVDVPTFQRLAFPRHGADEGFQASIPFPPEASSRWHPYALPLGDLAGRLCPGADHAVLGATVAPPTFHSGDTGYRAEARLVALLADDDRLNVFHAAPDLEMVEYCVRHVGTGAIVGVQVKAVSVNPEHPRGTIDVPPHTFRATPMSVFTIFAEHRDDRSPHPECLLIPSMDIGDILIAHAGELSLTWQPGSPRSDAAVAPYRLPVTELPGRLATLLETGTGHPSPGYSALVETRDTPIAVKTVEAAITARHVLRLTYTTIKAKAEELMVEPLAIRFNTAHHRVLWAWDVAGGHIEQLRLDGIESADDTGEAFELREWAPGAEETSPR